MVFARDGIRTGFGRAFLVLAAAVCVSTARAGAGDDAYAAGTKAYAEGRIDLAVAQFEHARRAGNNSPELHQALGSAYMRLGRFDDAEKEFKALTGNVQWAPLGYYNLGAVAVAADDKDQAARWYQLAYQSSSNETLRKQAAMQLSQLGVTPREKRLAFSVAVSGGYDSNITVSGIEEELVDIESNSDWFMDYSGSVGMRVWGDNEHGVRLTGSALYRDYGTVNRFDQGVARGGVVYDHKIGSVQSEAGLLAESTVLDGSQAQLAGIAYVQGIQPLTARQSVRGRYDASRFEGGDDFEFLSGWQHEGTAEYMIQSARVGLAVGYSYEYSDRDDRSRDVTVAVPSCPLLGPCSTVDVLLSEFSSFSPIRHRGYTRLVWKPEAGWTFRVEGEYQDSTYRDEDTVFAEGVELARVRRKEHRTSAVVGGERRVGRHWALTGDYAYTKNTSNMENFDYERNLVRFGVGFLY